MAVAGIACCLLRARRTEPITRSSPVHGDRALADRALRYLPQKGIHALGVAEVSSSGVDVATIGVPLNSTFEVGSINKGITGMLYIDAVERGEVKPDTTLGTLLGLSECQSADLTLEELSQHRSGLPSQPMGFADVARIVLKTALAKNPFDGATEKDLIRDLRRVTVGPKTPLYSNLGFAALGHALASAAGTDYPTLLRDRIAEPLKLEAFYVPKAGEAGLDGSAVQGRDEDGRAQQAWTDLQYAPAGGVRSSMTSMATLAQKLLDGSAPGAASLDPVASFSSDEKDRIGAGWVTSQIHGRTVTWHNGGTGGFSSWIGLDRDRNTAIVIAGATTLPLEETGEALLLGH